ncbi:tetratricopeptide repeat protein [Thermoflexus sp.]|uniref:tetratricopeptide repeat protein n=1 Tax=Thermoflexus sp. TaxID=1969742 RepID=UPI00261E7DEC|nr:tetratricopeptide repeat protein [Thermoflexus sp.]MCX7690904.1 tetratricopeptide repeat protein [Thermoflexus sp.]
MEGDRLRYEQALRRGHEAIWQKQWSVAIAAYREALEAFPDQPEALTGLGLACMEAGQYEGAVAAFRQLARLRPGDPTPALRLAEVYQRAGRAAEAAAHYHQAGRSFAEQGDLRRAVQAWVQAIRLEPGRVETLEALAQAYRQLHQPEAAIRVDLARARAWVQQGDLQRALEAVSAALALDPDHPQALQARDWLRAQLTHRTGTGPLPMLPPRGAEAETERARAEAFWMLPPEEAEPPVDPIRRALSLALQTLADLVFSEDHGAFSEEEWFRINAGLGRAVDAHSRGQWREALVLYEQVLAAGLEHPALMFAVGAILAELKRCDEAASQLQPALTSSAYHLAGLLLLARCEERHGTPERAVERYLEALEYIEQELLDKGQAEGLRERYRFLRAWILRHPDQQMVLQKEVQQILESPTWLDRVTLIRRALDQWTAGTPFQLTLAEALMFPEGERLLSELGQAYAWAQQGLSYSAVEEVMRIVAERPFAPLAHLALGQLLAWGHRSQAAVGKFRALGEYFLFMEDPYMALAAFEQALRLAPLDLPTLHRFLQLSQELGDPSRTIQAFAGMADAYLQMANLEQADRICREGLDWAARQGLPGAALRPLLLRLVEIAVQRLDWAQAIEPLERLRTIDPKDLEIRWGLAEAYLRAHRLEPGLQEARDLVDQARATGRLAEAASNLEELIALFPEEPGLRQLAAQVHLELGQMESAITHLEQIGEHYLRQGRLNDARAVYQSLIQLNPDRAMHYRALMG